MNCVNGVKLLPAMGKFTYGTTAHQGRRVTAPALPVVDGQWPQLDQLSSNSDVDLVCFDNLMPTLDWITGGKNVALSGQSDT